MKIYFALFLSLCLITSPTFAIDDPDNSDFDSFDSFESCETDIEAAHVHNDDDEDDDTGAVINCTLCVTATMVCSAIMFYISREPSKAPRYTPMPTPNPYRLKPSPIQMVPITNTTLQDMITNGTLTATDMPALTEILANMTETKVKEE